MGRDCSQWFDPVELRSPIARDWKNQQRRINGQIRRRRWTLIRSWAERILPSEDDCQIFLRAEGSDTPSSSLTLACLELPEPSKLGWE